MLSYLLWLSSEVKTMSSEREREKASAETCLYDKWVIRFDGDFYDKRPVRWSSATEQDEDWQKGGDLLQISGYLMLISLQHLCYCTSFQFLCDFTFF